MSYRRLLSVIFGSFMLLLLITPALAISTFSSWEPAANLESVPGTSPELNTPYLEGCPMLSSDGLQLYLATDRPGGLGGIDIWVAERASAQDPFGAPVNMGKPINSEYNDFCPSPLPNGIGFMFVSNRPKGCGGTDIYFTKRNPVHRWMRPLNLGCRVNSSADEVGPVLSFAESKAPTLYFSSTRLGGPGGSDLYQSQTIGLGLFGPAELVPGVNSTDNDGQPSIRSDGLELLFFSNRPGGEGGMDIWSASRSSINDPWSMPVNLGENVNSVDNESRPSLSWDGTMLLFGSNRPGGDGMSDIYYSTRD